MAVNDENCVLKLPCDNITFRLTFIKPFYILNVKLVDIKHYELKRDVKINDIIIIDTFKPINALKRDKGRSCKALNVNIFL
jgi:hypothetical protein